MAESTYADDYLRILTRRLEQLELQAAALGVQTPPNIIVEIEDIKAKIEHATIGSESIISIEILERMTPAQQYKGLHDFVWHQSKQIYTLQQNDTSNRINVRERHTEFNIAIQSVQFENALLKLNIRRLNVLFFSICILGMIITYIQLFYR